MRTFIALDLDPAIKTALRSLIQELKKSGTAVKWVGTEGMHLTLKFLGEISPDQVGIVQEGLRNAASHVSFFPVVVSGTGCFPNVSKPRVIWAGIEKSDALLELQKYVEKEMGSRGFPRENRPFHAHLTLGRVKGLTNIRSVIAEVEKYQEAVFGEMVVRRMTFFQSVLRPEGAEYRVISEFDLL